MPRTMRIVDAMEDRRSLRRPVVFVVDDDVATLGLLCEVAFESGWQARGFGSLAELRRGVDQSPPGLIILDDELPDGRGGDLAREFREDSRLTGVPVLVCTGAHPMRRAEIGAWAPVVSKPFELALIERFLAAAHPDAEAGRSRSDRAG